MKDDINAINHPLLERNKVIEPLQCPSEDACMIVNSFLDDSATEIEYEIRIERIKQQIIDSDFLIEDLKVKLNTQKEESANLRELLHNTYSELWRLYGKYKYEVSNL